MLIRTVCKAAIAGAVVWSLSGCYDKNMSAAVQDQVANDFADGQDALDRARVPGRPINKDIISISDDVWLGDAAIVSEHKDPLPRRFETDDGITVVTDGPLDFAEITNQIQYLTGIPTQLEDSIKKEDVQPLSVSYTGPISGLLNMLSSRINVSWVYDSGKIIFYKHRTRTFVLHTLSTESSFNVGVDSGAGSGSAATVNTKSDLREWAEIEAVIKSIVREGSVTMSPSTNSITVTSTPKTLARVESYVKEQNRRFAKQVAVTVRVLQVSMTRATDFGLDLTAIFGRTGSSQFGVTATSPNPTIGGVAFSILSGDNAGSQAALRALSSQGKTSLVTSAVVTARNNRVVPINNIQSFKYISSISTLTENTNSTTEVTPAEETVGFSMQIMPNILENGRLMLLFNMSLKELVRIETVSVGATKVQLPHIEQRNFMQELVMESGQTAVLTGFEKIQNNNSTTGLGANTFTAIGGSAAAQTQRDVLVVMLTPQIITSPLEIEDGHASEWDMPTY